MFPWSFQKCCLLCICRSPAWRWIPLYPTQPIAFKKVRAKKKPPVTSLGNTDGWPYILLRKVHRKLGEDSLAVSIQTCVLWPSCFTSRNLSSGRESVEGYLTEHPLCAQMSSVRRLAKWVLGHPGDKQPWKLGYGTCGSSNVQCRESPKKCISYDLNFI